MKKQKFLAPLALSAAALAGGLFLSGNTYAAGVNTISISYSDGSGSTASCYVYGSPNPSMACAEGVGSFDAENNVLTINNIMENAKMISIIAPTGTTPDPVTFKINQDLNISSIISDGINLILDLGEHQLQQTHIVTPTMTMKSGIFSGDTSANDITINGGSFTNADSATYDNLTINHGVVSIKQLYVENLLVTGGTLNSSHIILKNNGSNDNAVFELQNGEVNIDGGDSESGTCIVSGLATKNITTIISGGELNIKNCKYGIMYNGLDTSNSTINFNGGVTIFENTPTYAISITHNTNSENAIKFATGMGIKEPHTFVFWTDDTYGDRANETGIVSRSSTVTIANGYTVEKFKGWDIGEIDPLNPVDDDTPVKVPDTGANSNEEGGNALAIFAASTFILLGIFGLAVALKIHAAGHFKLNK